MIQTCQPGDECLTVESFRCNGCREQGWELVPMDPSHETSDLCSRAKQAFETYLTEQWMPWLTMSCSHISDHFEHEVGIDVGTWMGVHICASKMASWKFDAPALAWPGIRLFVPNAANSAQLVGANSQTAYCCQTCINQSLQIYQQLIRDRSGIDSLRKMWNS